MTEENEVQSVQSLESKIKNAISEIAASKTSPYKSGIGLMFRDLHELDPAAAQVMVQEYKPVCLAYNENIKKRLAEINKKVEEETALSPDEKDILKAEEQKKKDAADRTREKAARIDAALNSVLKGGTAGGVEYGDTGSKKAPKVRAPKTPKTPANPDGERDRTVFELDGEIFGKGPLVLAILRRDCQAHPKITHDDLKNRWPDKLHRSYGVFQKLDKAQQISAQRKRYFLKDEDLLKISGCVIAVCNQWGVGNITPFVEHAVKQGYKIKTTTKA